MAAIEILDRNPGSDLVGADGKSRLAIEVERILGESEHPATEEQPRSRQWSYRVPFAGVRYYSF